MKVNDFIKLLFQKKSSGGNDARTGADSAVLRRDAENRNEIHAYAEKIGAERIETLGKGNNETWSCKVLVKGRWMKCYQAETSERANLIASTTACLANQGINAPEIHDVSGRMLLAEWIEGKTALDVDAKRLATYQQQLHNARIDAPLSQSNSKALHLEWLFRRLATYGKNHVDSNSISKVIESVRRLLPPESEVRVIHPDFIRSNIIVNVNGELVVVDNEFLGVGLGFEFDILNSARVMFRNDPRLQEEYISCCRECGPCGTLVSHRQFWEIVMLVKVAGKRFMLQDVKTGLEYFNELNRRLKEY